ncbi:molybdopterin-guanine dinucleotide biosynthesis protein MobA [Thalassospira xiamenensis]|uniref:molybdenum cofactor guanylyltransferase MobA n=1 Tax=Thalassospira xiamenensis TaxID=220697 RepID=UPI000DED3BE2|nr:molybdenum cofactor guanylyltransferase MobA [Thalassospira xiamenensis]RCK34152.1 molybdopterin-guanine dinucleotide biosynthesis protein MobA [Thalassospira xiamenensis]
MSAKANSISNHPKVAGLILAGGEGRRMGGNKPFRELAGKPLIAHAISAAARQCNHLMISSNQGASLFAAFNLPVIPDKPEPGHGPLGGILGGLSALPDNIDWLVSFPVDCPIVPDDMALQLIKAATDAGKKAAFASHAGRDHYLSAVWHRDTGEIIMRQLAADDRRVGGALDVANAVVVDFPVEPGQSTPFTNINTPIDLNVMDAVLASLINLSDR